MLLPIEFNHNVSEKSFWKTDSHYNLSLLSREKEAYIALKLVKDTNSYFGWMRFWFKTDDKLYIDNYAYNKTANESILAGKLQAGY